MIYTQRRLATSQISIVIHSISFYLPDLFHKDIYFFIYFSFPKISLNISYKLNNCLHLKRRCDKYFQRLNLFSILPCTISSNLPVHLNLQSFDNLLNSIQFISIFQKILERCMFFWLTHYPAIYLLRFSLFFYWYFTVRRGV